MGHAAELVNAFDAVAGFLGAFIAITYQPRRSYFAVITSLLVGTVSAIYGAPALAEWQNLSRVSESLCAALIGLTAQTHLIPSIMESATVVGKLPSEWIKKKYGR